MPRYFQVYAQVALDHYDDFTVLEFEYLLYLVNVLLYKGELLRWFCHTQISVLLDFCSRYT